jgi:hypothetical protein
MAVSLSAMRKHSDILMQHLQRQSRSRPAPRPAASAPSNSRGAHTATAPVGSAPPAPTPVASAPAAAQAPTQSQPGMLAQMAATAGSVAVGSTIGHGISSLLFGGSRSEPAPAAEPIAQSAPVQQQQYAQGVSCEVQAKGTLYKYYCGVLRRF